MKNHIFSIGLLAVLAISCSIHEMDFKDANAFEEFYASIENAETPDTKVFATEELYLRWNADDRITIFNKYTYNQEYRFTGETGDNSGSFKKVDNGDFVTGNSLDNIYAIYPFLESTRISDTGVITVTLPAEQKYAENTMGLGANSMVSATTDNQLLFKNVGGYLMLKLYGDDVTVSSITLKGNNGERIAGKATVTMPVNGVPSVVMSETAGQEITLVCETPVKIGSTAETATKFWIVVPPTVFSKGFTLTVKDNMNGVFEKSTTKGFEIRRNTLSRMSALEVKIESSGPSSNVIVFADSKLKERLITEFDIDRDGELSFSEAAAVTSIDGVLTIKTYTSFDEFQYFTGVTSIPDDCFRDWTKLTSIILPPNITSIGKSAFYDCPNLISVNIPNKVKSIGQYAFSGCSELPSITIPNSVTVLGDCAFLDCSSLSSIIIPESLSSIGVCVFASCSSLTSVYIPESVTTIGRQAFCNCYSLTSINIPDSVIRIEEQAFANCTGFTSFYIPESVTYIGDCPLSGCNNLSTIVVDPDNLSYDSRNNCNAIIQKSNNLLISGCAKTIIPEDIRSIGREAFFDCTGLTSISLPNSVTWIAYMAFGNCSGLLSISLPNSVTGIDQYAFTNCSSLNSFIIPESVTSIGRNAFQDCNSLTEITCLRESPPTGGSRMFYNTDCPIYVPSKSIEAYKTAQYWRDYADRIQAIPSPFVPVPDAVDLGLPSGLKWASFNLGASKAEEYGDYYAWGETEPYYSSQDPLTWKAGKESGYGWSSYKWCMGSENTLTKYCYNSEYGYNGYTDSKTVLDPEDDAAYLNLGGSWRMPTDAEWTELRENCTWTWTMQNGVSGHLVTASNGNSIFLPAAGLRNYTHLNNAGSTGYYWSSSLDTDRPRVARDVNFSSGYVGGRSGYRDHGRSVRPVTE